MTIFRYLHIGVLNVVSLAFNLDLVIASELFASIALVISKTLKLWGTAKIVSFILYVCLRHYPVVSLSKSFDFVVI